MGICVNFSSWEKNSSSWEKYFGYQNISWYFLGLVGINTKMNFILRYARFAIKSDYFNLILESCFRFLSYKLLEIELIKSHFLFFSFDFFFLGTEEVLRLFANLHAFSCPRSTSILYFTQNSEKIWWVVHFPVENIQEVCRISLQMENS